MLNADDAAELRSLQVKAYGRDGGLSDAEALRLRELENARVEPADAPEPEAAPEAPRETEGDPAPQTPARDEPDGAGDPVDATATASDPHIADAEASASLPSGLRAALRQHVAAVAAASALLLVVGLVAGWALFGRSTGGIDLTSQQQERRSELQAGGDFDDGTIRAIGEDGDALVWFGTTQGGEMNCIVLDVGDRSSTGCQRVEDETNPYGYGFSVQVLVGEGEDAEEVSASAVRAANGEMVAIIQRWASSPDSWLTQFAGEDRTRAEELIAAGYDRYSFSIVGEFGGDSVWQAMRSDGGVPQQCLIVDAVGAVTCLEPEKAQSEDGIRVSGASIDGETGDVLGEWSVTLAYTSAGMPYLVISGDDPALLPTAAAGDSIELGGEHGDPIRVTIPGDDPEN